MCLLTPIKDQRFKEIKVMQLSFIKLHNLLIKLYNSRPLQKIPQEQFSIGNAYM
jgi:hypothetical protein